MTLDRDPDRDDLVLADEEEPAFIDIDVDAEPTDGELVGPRYRPL